MPVEQAQGVPLQQAAGHFSGAGIAASTWLPLPRFVMKWLVGHSATQTKKQEPAGLHDNTVYSTYGQVEEPPVLEADDLVGYESMPRLVAIDGEGFKFTIERDGQEHILSNVDVAISASLKEAKGHNRLVQTEDNIFELRNLTLPSAKMGRFFFTSCFLSFSTSLISFST